MALIFSLSDFYSSPHFLFGTVKVPIHSDLFACPYKLINICFYCELMFLRKLFKIGDKVKWLTLELLVVFIGVYLAFLFQSYNENTKLASEGEKVFSSLKSELEFFRVQMPGRSGFTLKIWKELKDIESQKQYSDFSDWRFLEPQYGYQVIEYAINLQSSEIVDFELYDKLQVLYATIKRLEHAERMIMQMAQRHVAVPQQLSRSEPEVALRHAENYQNFKRLLVFLHDRAEDQQEVADRSEDCLRIINARMNPETRRNIESGLIKMQLGQFDTVQDAIEAVRRYFPDFTQEEIKGLYEEISSK